jgi:hypothetical protein
MNPSSGTPAQTQPPGAPRPRRRKAAAILGVVGAFLLSSGLVLISQSTAQSAAAPNHVDVEVCHATGSDSNPYNDLTVSDNAGGAGAIGGHLMHRNAPNKTWQGDGVWNGVVHHAGDLKRDYIHSYTDENGIFHDFGDDAFFARGGCNSVVLTLVTPGVTWQEPDCTHAAGFVGADTAHIDYAVTAGSLGNGTTVTVTATAHAGYSFAGGTTQDFTHTFNSYDPKLCAPPTVVTPNVTWTEPDCTHAAGFTGADTADIDYAVTAGTVGPGNTVTVTATAHAGFAFDAGGTTTKTFTHTFNAFDPASCRGGGGGPGGGGGGTPPPNNPPPNNPPPVVAPPTVVTVSDPVFDDPSCSDPNGAAVRLPGMNTRTSPAGPITLTSVVGGVTYVATGTLGALGTVTVTATAGPGTTLAPGSTTTWTHKFAAVSCPSVADHPAQASVPTFVDSGLDPQATTETVVATGRLRAWGISLTTVGGLVVAGAFWLGVGRRRRGVAV